MNILIVDDNQDKKQALARCIYESDENAVIKWVNNYRDAVKIIEDYGDRINLIIIGWSFPLNSTMRSSYGLASLLIEYIRCANLNIKTYICTNDQVNIDTEQYPFVKKVIHFDINDIANFNLKDVFHPGELVTHAKKYNKRNENRTNTGYVRRRSSTPWWL